MGRIPQSFIQDLLSRIDIVDFIQARVNLKKRGNNYLGLCPFHNEKNTFIYSKQQQTILLLFRLRRPRQCH